MSGQTVYSRAADIIRDRGWWDGTVDSANGVCIQLALQQAAEIPEDSVDAGPYEAAWAAAEAHLGLPRHGFIGDALPLWNDKPHRTVEDVLLVLKELHVKAGGA